MLALSFFQLLLAASTFASPPPRQSTSNGRCSVPNSALTLPPNQTQLVKPTSAPLYVTLGVGVQNYTCTSSNTYTSLGALAEVFDISCFYNQGFSNIQGCVDEIWWGCPNMTQSELVTRLQNDFGLNLLGQHYFIQGPSSNALIPVWDFRSTTSNPDAIMIANKTGDIPAPTGPGDIDWLELKNVSGGLAGELLRVFTYEGQPPPSCTPGSPPISVKYSSQYCRATYPNRSTWRSLIDLIQGFSKMQISPFRAFLNRQLRYTD